MNNSFTRLIDGMTATLRTEVMTRLDDEFARGQVIGVINLLNTFRLRADWSVGFLHDEVTAQRQAFAKLDEMLLTSGIAAPDHPRGELPPPLDSSMLQSLRDDGNRAIIELMRWLWSRPDGLTPERAAAIETELRRAMRTEVQVELKHSSKPMFAEMSQGAEDAPRADS